MDARFRLSLLEVSLYEYVWEQQMEKHQSESEGQIWRIDSNHGVDGRDRRPRQGWDTKRTRVSPSSIMNLMSQANG